MLQPLAGLEGDRAVAAYFTAAAMALGADVPICVQDFPKPTGCTFQSIAGA
jgi:dihydrodipicolinate synthase/N-acetylneuraminate lyase